MSALGVYILIILILISNIRSEVKFCEKNRNLLLGGVFNYNNIIFVYSWKVIKQDINDITPPQLPLTWTYVVKNKRLKAVGTDMVVDQVFPDLPLFKAGFGLTLKCDPKDTECQSYRQLVFIFFQSNYKVYRFSNRVFGAEVNKEKIPWGLKPRGEAADWFFGESAMDNIHAIMFLGGYQSQIFVVSKNALFVSSVDVKSSSLKWTKLTENQEFNNALGGFIVGSDLFINKNNKNTPDNELLKYDRSGKQSEKISVWKYFGCDDSDTTNTRVDSEAAIDFKGENKEIAIESDLDKQNNLALFLLICVVVVIVLVNIIVGAFWLTVYHKNKSSSES